VVEKLGIEAVEKKCSSRVIRGGRGIALILIVLEKVQYKGGFF